MNMDSEYYVLLQFCEYLEAEGLVRPPEECNQYDDRDYDTIISDFRREQEEGWW